MKERKLTNLQTCGDSLMKRSEIYRMNYKERKEQARQKAIAWQYDSTGVSPSYSELAKVGAHFRKVGKRYGLLREFRENGIPC